MKIWNLMRKCRLWLCTFGMTKRPNISIICNNCLGGMLYHDFGIRFNSPFINLMIPTPQYIELLNELDSIKKFDVVDITPNGNRYPIGLLHNKYELHFMHYDSFVEAKDKWKQRVERIDVENLYVILVETHSSCYQDLVNFENLSFKNKIIVTHKAYPEIKCSVPIKDYDGINSNGEILWPMNRWGKTKYDQIDWVSFLNLR